MYFSCRWRFIKWQGYELFEKKKNIKIKKTQKIFDDNPRIKLYGELPFNVQNYIKASTNFNNAQDGGGGCLIL